MGVIGAEGDCAQWCRARISHGYSVWNLHCNQSQPTHPNSLFKLTTRQIKIEMSFRSGVNPVAARARYGMLCYGMLWNDVLCCGMVTVVCHGMLCW